jgi:hypothetical protein
MQPAVFATMLIARALSSVAGSEDITKEAARFILSQRSENWSWNYWRRYSSKSKQTPYPDDLDDTANAFAVLQACDSGQLSGGSWAHFGHLLISNEKNPGGPYTTWIRPPHDTVWHDIDPVVNATIGHVLHVEGVAMPKLIEYFQEILVSDSLQSPYYVSDIPTLYFLSSWLPARQQLKRRITDKLAYPQSHNALMLSLLITSGYRVGVSKTLLDKAVARLVELRQADAWQAEAFYKDPVQNGQQYYAGSSVMTTAFAIEALWTHMQEPRKAEANPPSRSLQHLRDFIQTQPHVLQEPYRAVLQRIEESDRQQQISNGAGIFAAAAGVTLLQDAADNLNLASLHGWIAYTIYDDFLDDEGKGYELSIANISHRAMVRHFNDALPIEPLFATLVNDTLDVVDTANAWEGIHARATITKNALRYTLPDYNNLSQLAARSQGHMLVACAVMMHADHTDTSTGMEHLKTFFHHFLIAKQLNDDVHDWRDDLQRGHLSAVVTMVLRDLRPAQCQPSKDMPQLEKHFWQHTVHDINTLILEHCDKAEQAFAKIPLAQPEIIGQLLLPLRGAVRDTTQRYNQTKDFVDSLRTQLS